MAKATAVAQTPVQNAFLDRAIGYARVSSEEQARDSHALQNHIERIRERIGPSAKIFTDVAGRSSTRRPGFQALLDFIEKEDVKYVVAARPDRLGHSKNAGCQCAYEWLRRRNKIVTVFLDFDIDLATPGGRLMLDQLVSVSKFEQNMLSVRIRAHKQVRMKRGESLSQPPFGYARVGGTLVLDTFAAHCFLNQAPVNWKVGDPLDEGITNAGLVKLLLEEVIKTGSYAQAVRNMKRFNLTAVNKRAPLQRYDMDDEGIYRCVWPTFPPCLSSVRNWCFHPAYRGHTGMRRNYNAGILPSEGDYNRAQIYGSDDTYEFFYENTHEPLITEKQYQRILEIERACKVRHGAHGVRGPRDPFSGLLFCNDCGTRLKFESRRSAGKGAQGKVYSYYKCPNPRCTSLGLRVATADLLGMLARRLARIARAVQSGERVLPAIDEADLTQIEAYDDLIGKMRSMGDTRLDAQIAHLEALRKELAQEPDDDSSGLSGTGWQMLRQPKACNDADWFVFLSRPEVQPSTFVKRIVVGYASDEDRPTQAPSKGGRRKASQTGRPTILDVEPL